MSYKHFKGTQAIIMKYERPESVMYNKNRFNVSDGPNLKFSVSSETEK